MYSSVTLIKTSVRLYSLQLIFNSTFKYFNNFNYIYIEMTFKSNLYQLSNFYTNYLLRQFT